MDMTTTKTVVVFAIIFGCFAVLYPKIFHPMVLHLFGFTPAKHGNDDVLNRVPPHLRKGPGPARVLQEDITRHMRDEHPGSFRPGPHPGLRAAAEMKKQAATTTGTGKGMMGVVLPMYAVGIVVYLIYTLTKVFGKKEEKKEDFLSNNPFNDIRYDPSKKEFKYSDGQEDSDDEKDVTKTKARQRDLERLLLRADERNIRYTQLCDQILSQSAVAVATEAEIEMRQLRARLLETEAQMSRILKAMETVSEKVVPKEGDDLAADDLAESATASSSSPPPSGAVRTVDSSPDMDSYEIIDGSEEPGERRASRGDPDGTVSDPDVGDDATNAQVVEDVGPAGRSGGDRQEVAAAAAAAESTSRDKDASAKREEGNKSSSQPESEQVAPPSVEAGIAGEPEIAAKDTESATDAGEEATSPDRRKADDDHDDQGDDAAGSDDQEAMGGAGDGAEEGVASSTEQKIPEKKEQVQEPRPDLRKRKQGKKARRDN